MILTLGYIWTIRNVYDAGLLHIVVFYNISLYSINIF
jgi:hypothetical protein